MTSTERIRDFILREGARERRIAARLRPEIERNLRTMGFQRVIMNCGSLSLPWRVTMTQPPPFRHEEEIDRILAGIVGQLAYRDERFQIRNGLIVTVLLQDQVKSAFCLAARLHDRAAWPRFTSPFWRPMAPETHGSRRSLSVDFTD